MKYLLIIITILTLLAPLIVGVIIYFKKYKHLQKLKEDVEETHQLVIPTTGTKKEVVDYDYDYNYDEEANKVDQFVEDDSEYLEEEDLDQIPMFTPIMNLLPELPR